MALTEVRAQPTLNNDERASIIAWSAISAELVGSEPDATKTAIAEALRRTDHLQKIDDPELLKVVGDIVSEALADRSATPEAGGFEVRGPEAKALETRGRVKDRRNRSNLGNRQAPRQACGGPLRRSESEAAMFAHERNSPDPSPDAGRLVFKSEESRCGRSGTG